MELIIYFKIGGSPSKPWFPALQWCVCFAKSGGAERGLHLD